MCDERCQLELVLLDELQRSLGSLPIVRAVTQQCKGIRVMDCYQYQGLKNGSNPACNPRGNPTGKGQSLPIPLRVTTTERRLLGGGYGGYSGADTTTQERHMAARPPQGWHNGWGLAGRALECPSGTCNIIGWHIFIAIRCGYPLRWAA